MPSETRPEPQRAPARLYLVMPPLNDAAGLADMLKAALDGADVAAVLLHLPDAGDDVLIERIEAIVPAVQDNGAALLLAGHAGLVARAGADGAHLHGIDAFNKAIETLKPERIAGAGGLQSRHDAMLAAEAGADYVMFGECDSSGQRPAFAAIEERIAWWAEVFQVPCVGCAEGLDEIAPLVAASADFVALSDCIWNDARGPAAALKVAGANLRIPETAA